MLYILPIHYKIIFLAVIISLFILTFDSDLLLWINIVAVLFIGLTVYMKQTSIILFLIISLLVVTSDINETLRITLNISALGYIAYIFLKEYGLQFSKYPRIPNTISLYIVLTITLMTASSIFSEHLLVGLTETLRQTIFFCICYILYVYMGRETNIYKYIHALIAAAIILSLIIIYSFLNSDVGVYLLQAKGIVHEGGSFKNVTAVGGIFSITIPLNLILFLQATGANKKRSLLFILIIFQVLGIFLTNSRSGLFAVIISSSIILFILKRSSFIKYLVYTICFSSILFFFIPALSDLIAIYFRVDRIFENTRYQLWDMSLNIIKDNLFLGVGPGQFKNYMYNYIPVMLGSWEESQIAWIYQNAGLGESHNFYFFRSAELGILGFVGAILLPIIFISICYKVIKLSAQSQKNYYLAVGIFSTGVGIFVRAFFESTGIISNGWIIRDLPFWICFMVIIQLYVSIVVHDKVES